MCSPFFRGACLAGARIWADENLGLDHRFVHKDITTSLQDLKGFEYDHQWLKYTGYTYHIPYGILEDGRNDDQGQNL